MANKFDHLTATERASAPSTPATGDWAIYFKSDGFYVIDDTGTESGPFQAGDLAAHLADTADAHDASAISYAGGTGMSATDVEAAIDELATEKANLAGGTFTGDISVPDEAYDATAWNGSLEVPTKNAIRDKIETMGGGGSVATDSIFDAKGDLPAGTGADTAAKLTVGSNGQVLTADSTQATGLIWATPSAGGGSAFPAPLDLTLFNAVYGTGITSYDEEFSASGSSLPTGWSWANQETASYREQFGAGTITAPSAASDMRMIVRSLPSESTWTAHLWLSDSLASNVGSDSAFFGLVLRDSATGKNAMLRRATTSGIITSTSANDNFGSAANYVAGKTTTASGMACFKVKRNSATSYDFEFSTDGGVSWTQVDMARNMTGHFTPDQIGMVVQNNLGWQIEVSAYAFRVR